MRRRNRSVQYSRPRFEFLERRALLTQLFDMDGNGQNDVVGSNAWYDVVAPGEIVEHQILDGSDAIMHVADLDGDGDPDLLTNASRWVENQAGQFTRVHPIGTFVGDWSEGPNHGMVLDVDGDGDPDILTWVDRPTKITWLRNNGRGVFAAEIVEAPIGNGTYRFGDIDGDGIQEVLGLFQDRIDDPNAFPDADGYYVHRLVSQEFVTNERKQLWTVQQPFKSQFLLVTNYAFEVVDLDGDGAQDIFLHLRTPLAHGPLAWLRNDGGDELPSAYEVIAPEYPHSIYLEVEFGDLGSDGDLDIILNSSVGPAPLSYWFDYLENQDGKFIRRDLRFFGAATDFLDINGDTVIDFIGESIYGPPVWRDGATGARHYMGNPDAQRWIADIQSAIYDPDFLASHPHDWDLDGSKHVSVRDVELALESLGTGAGDTNLDGIFDSTDLIQAFQLGHFERNGLTKATWLSGDWNTDGKFDSEDLILAFQSGKYRP